MRRYLLLVTLVAMVFKDQVVGQSAMTAPEDTVILIRPEELRILPKSILERKLGMEAENVGAPAAILPEKAVESLTEAAGKEESDRTFEREQQRMFEEFRRKEEERAHKRRPEEEKQRRPQEDEERKVYESEQPRRFEESRRHEEQGAHRRPEEETSRRRTEEEQETSRKKPEEELNAYVAVGTVKFVFDNTTEPFTLFFDGIEKRSRVDLGARALVRSLALSKENSMYRIEFPRGGETLDKAVCIEMRGSQDRPVKILNAVQDLKRFERVGEDTINNVKVNKWRYELKDDDLKAHHTFWLFTEVETKKPVRLEVFLKSKQSNKLLDHYIVDYKYFFTTRPSNDIFAKPVDVECRSIVGLSEIKEEHLRTAGRPELDRERLFINPLAAVLDPDVHLTYERELDKLFEGFQKKYNKKYNSEEVEIRRAAFCHNFRYINLLNRAGLSYKLRINHLTDRTNDELRKMLGVRGVGNLDTSSHVTRFNAKEHNIRGIESVPKSIDWRILGGLTSVSDQGTCGSDWAIAAKSVIESALFLRTKRLMKLSPQELLDCAHETGNKDCHNGTPWQAYEYVLKNGIASELYYGRLLNRKDECKKTDAPISAKIKRWVLVGKDEEELKRAVAFNGPVATIIDAAHKSFFFYSSGIYKESNCRSEPNFVNHAVVVAGYGNLNGRDYFLLKNSFSNDWGLNGYMLIDAHGNQCGILSAPTFVDM